MFKSDPALKVSAPTVNSPGLLFGETVPPLATLTDPGTVPLPPKVPPEPMVTDPGSVPFTTSVPALIVVPPDQELERLLIITFPGPFLVTCPVPPIAPVILSTALAFAVPPVNALPASRIPPARIDRNCAGERVLSSGAAFGPNCTAIKRAKLVDDIGHAKESKRRTRSHSHGFRGIAHRVGVCLKR